jgi:hypothetical protein
VIALLLLLQEPSLLQEVVPDYVEVSYQWGDIDGNLNGFGDARTLSSGLKATSFGVTLGYNLSPVIVHDSRAQQIRRQIIIDENLAREAARDELSTQEKALYGTGAAAVVAAAGEALRRRRKAQKENGSK